MRKNFDDHCEELEILRWFRDHFVSKEDIEHYYITAPIIVSAIDCTQNNDLIYDYICEHVIETCVKAIRQGDYEFAYHLYKGSVLVLEEQFARPSLACKLAKTLKLKINK